MTSNNRHPTKPCRVNVDFGISGSATLLPSTGRWLPFDVDGMESIHVGAAFAINNLAIPSLVRRPSEINNLQK